jgi:hypothetical protein
LILVAIVGVLAGAVGGVAGTVVMADHWSALKGERGEVGEIGPAGATGPMGLPGLDAPRIGPGAYVLSVPRFGPCPGGTKSGLTSLYPGYVVLANGLEVRLCEVE